MLTVLLLSGHWVPQELWGLYINDLQPSRVRSLTIADGVRPRNSHGETRDISAPFARALGGVGYDQNKTVVAGLWRVEDQSTAQLMHSMYLALATDGTDVAGALQQAQTRLRALTVDGRHPYAHPYYWAGFVVSTRELPFAG